MRSTLAIAAALALSTTACVSVEINRSDDRIDTGDFGEATLKNGSGVTVGRAITTQGPRGLLIRIEAEGLTPGWHGIHLHAVGDCSDAGFKLSGGHVNHADHNKPHGLLNPDGPDAGDLPNVFADGQGRVRAEVFTTRARIAADGPGEYLWDADGSAIVIHANADDHQTQPIGGAGDRVACGVLAAG